MNYTMDHLSVPEYVIKKGRPHGHRYGKMPGDKEYHTANQLKKECKKKFFQGIHDRFIRDPEFRKRMVENNRDEELCRTWDARADEDHSHDVTAQEYSLYKSNRWLHSNKQGSSTVRTTHRSDFKKALSTFQQFKETEEAQRNQQWAQSSSSWWNWQGSWWTRYSSESHDGDETKYWQNGAICCSVSGIILLGKTFLNSITLLHMDRLQLTSVYCNRRGVSMTPQMACFRGASVQNIATGKVTIN